MVHVRLIVCMLVLSMTAVAAQTAVSEFFDTTKPVTLKGTTRRVHFMLPNAYLFIDVKDGDGKSEVWAVQGNAPGALIKQGWKFVLGPGGTVSLGDTVTVRAFPGRRGADMLAAIPAGAPPEVADLAKAGRLMRGIEVALADGKTMPFGDLR